MVYGRNTRPFSDGVVGRYSSGKWYTYILPCKEKVAKETRIRIADNKRRNVRDLEDLCSRFNGYAFEEYCAALFCAEGYDAQMTYKSGDGSADIILKTPTEERVIAECKCYKKKRGKTFFLRVLGLLVDLRVLEKCCSGALLHSCRMAVVYSKI